MKEETIVLFGFFATFVVGTMIVLGFILMIRKQRVVASKETQRELYQLQTHIVQEVSQLKDKMNQDLLAFQSAMSSSVKEDMYRLGESTNVRLGTIETKMSESMEKGLKTTYESFSKVMEQMARIDETQKNLNQLSHQITALQAIFTDKKHRGIFGEVELYSLLELQFGVNQQRYQKQYQLTTGKIADAVLFAPKPLGMVAIDAKFPLENYNRMYDTSLSKQEQERARVLFRQDVIGKIKDIASKYIVSGETASFAYMFIPAEAVFAEIYGRFDDVIQYSYEAQVYLVSPTTLMAYLTAIQAIYLGQERNEKMEVMQGAFVKLGKEFSRFEDRWDKLGSDFKRVHQDFHDVSITTGKLAQRFRNVENLQLNEEGGLDLITREASVKDNEIKNERKENESEPEGVNVWGKNKHDNESENERVENKKEMTEDIVHAFNEATPFDEHSDETTLLHENKADRPLGSPTKKRDLRDILAQLDSFEEMTWMEEEKQDEDEMLG